MKLAKTFLLKAFWALAVSCPLGATAVTYYLDSNSGNDGNTGTSDLSPWQSIGKIQNTALSPGDVVAFKRGSSYTVPFFVNYSGTASAYIWITDYGDSAAPAPSFTNPVFAQNNFGNCLRIAGSYVVVQNLYFHNTAAFVDGSYTSDGGWIVWEMGAVHIARGADNCIVQNNEFYDCVAGIRSKGKFAYISGNYIHDCNRALKGYPEYSWGPLGIWMGADFQTIHGNTIKNMQVVDSNTNHFSNGVGGGAFEIDDGRYNKFNIVIDRNFTQANCGFLEVVFNDVQPDPRYENWKIVFNVSDDYQAFVKLRKTKNCNVDNNTILRRKINSQELGVFELRDNNLGNAFRNNIIMTKYGVEVFNVAQYSPGSFIKNNLYFAVGQLVMGGEGPGVEARYGDAMFANIAGGSALDYRILSTSPAKNYGRDLGYSFDFVGFPIPWGNYPDMGAFEWHP